MGDEGLKVKYVLYLLWYLWNLSILDCVKVEIIKQLVIRKHHGASVAIPTNICFVMQFIELFNDV